MLTVSIFLVPIESNTMLNVYVQFMLLNAENLPVISQNTTASGLVYINQQTPAQSQPFQSFLIDTDFYVNTTEDKSIIMNATGLYLGIQGSGIYGLYQVCEVYKLYYLCSISKVVEGII